MKLNYQVIIKIRSICMFRYVASAILIVHIFCILFVILLHLSCNKSANFLVLNIYFTEDNNEEKEN